jgi:dihydropteroate synthase
MHSRGSMERMPGFSTYPQSAYADVTSEVTAELSSALHRAFERGVPRESLLVDPGLGFHKSAEHSYTLLRRLPELCALAPVVVGASRKSFLARDVPSEPADRLGGTVAACLHAARRGAAVLRVHDVRAVRQALAVARAVEGTG